MAKHDLDKAYERGAKDGRIEGYEYFLTLCYCSLAEMGFTQDELYKIHMNINQETEKIRRLGRPYYVRLKDRLDKEYGIRFHWGKDLPMVQPIAPKAMPDLEAFLKNLRGYK